MKLSHGLKFRKLDLHVHTPASSDYKEKNVTPEDIVNAALAKKLSGIAITDHQGSEWVDKIKKAAKDKLTIFPGVELLVTGGERGVHILILFDVDKNTTHIKQFLHKIDIFEGSDSKSAVDLTVGKIADELDKYDSSSILILAHCHSSKGVTGDIKGETRTLIFEKNRKCLLGAEANESDFLDTNKKQHHKRVIDCFDGTDANYNYKKLGVYQSSDAHSLDEIGSSYSYFKVDYPISIEDIRQSLIDRDTRIRQSFEYNEILYPHINSLKISDGFLQNQEFEFHEGLNSILGAKGSGKSLAIEFLRFALNQPSKNNEINSDHNSKLEKCLKLNGTVEIKFTDESGKKYLVIRTYNPEEGNQHKIIDISDESNKEFAIEQLFPVLFISQNEIIRIAEDKTGTSQREFIDRFFDFIRFQHNIERFNKKLSEIDKEYTDSLKAHLEVQKLKGKIATSKEEIDRIGRQLKNDTFEQYSKMEAVGQAINNQMDFIDSLEEVLKNVEGKFKDLFPPITHDDEIDSYLAVKKSFDLSRNTVNDINKNIQDMIISMENNRGIIVKEYTAWNVEFKKIKEQYEKLVKETGGTQIILDQRRKKVNSELSFYEKELSKYKIKAEQMNSVANNRFKIIDSLENAYKEYFIERLNRCNFFTECSAGSLNVTIQESVDRSDFKNNLLKIKKGSFLREEDIEIISNKIPPGDLINSILSYELAGRTVIESLRRISDMAELPIEKIEKLVLHILETYSYGQILALLYTSYPKDIPSINYKVGNEFKKLDELSVGQKSIALLIIALSDGNFPIVIDQPEDSLDLRSIWDDVCQKLRGSKEKRQFIFTTHNSSVAVASDTDKFTILQADAYNGKILYRGSLNRKDIKDEVIDYLEGGTDTYDMKRKKYNL